MKSSGSDDESAISGFWEYSFQERFAHGATHNVAETYESDGASFAHIRSPLKTR